MDSSRTPTSEEILQQIIDYSKDISYEKDGKLFFKPHPLGNRKYRRRVLKLYRRKNG